MPDFGAAADAFASEPLAGRPPIIMVHGAFCGGWCFDDFRIPFEAAGHAVSAPDLPGHAEGEGATAVLGRSMRDYASAMIEHVRACPEPPILIGHSMGGLVCQLAAQQVPLAALVLLAPSPPWGQAVTGPVETASAFALWTKGAYFNEAIAPEWPVVRGVTLDRMPEAQARATYARMVPESGRALFEVLNWWLDASMATVVNPSAVRAPVLAITGEHDRIHSPASVRLTAARFRGEYREAPGLSHWTMGEPGWRGVADTVLGWLATMAVKAPQAAPLA